MLPVVLNAYSVVSTLAGWVQPAAPRRRRAFVSAASSASGRDSTQQHGEIGLPELVAPWWARLGGVSCEASVTAGVASAVCVSRNTSTSTDQAALHSPALPNDEVLVSWREAVEGVERGRQDHDGRACAAHGQRMAASPVDAAPLLGTPGDGQTALLQCAGRVDTAAGKHSGEQAHTPATCRLPTIPATPTPEARAPRAASPSPLAACEVPTVWNVSSLSCTAVVTLTADAAADATAGKAPSASDPGPLISPATTPSAEANAKAPSSAVKEPSLLSPSTSFASLLLAEDAPSTPPLCAGQAGMGTGMCVEWRRNATCVHVTPDESRCSVSGSTDTGEGLHTMAAESRCFAPGGVPGAEGDRHLWRANEAFAAIEAAADDAPQLQTSGDSSAACTGGHAAQADGLHSPRLSSGVSSCAGDQAEAEGSAHHALLRSNDPASSSAEVGGQAAAEGSVQQTLVRSNNPASTSAEGGDQAGAEGGAHSALMCSGTTASTSAEGGSQAEAKGRVLHQTLLLSDDAVSSSIKGGYQGDAQGSERCSVPSHAEGCGQAESRQGMVELVRQVQERVLAPCPRPMLPAPGSQVAEHRPRVADLVRQFEARALAPRPSGTSAHPPAPGVLQVPGWHADACRAREAVIDLLGPRNPMFDDDDDGVCDAEFSTWVDASVEAGGHRDRALLAAGQGGAWCAGGERHTELWPQLLMWSD